MYAVRADDVPPGRAARYVVLKEDVVHTVEVHRAAGVVHGGGLGARTDVELRQPDAVVEL